MTAHGGPAHDEEIGVLGRGDAPQRMRGRDVDCDARMRPGSEIVTRGMELEFEYSIILPLMIAIVVATAISERLSPDSIYSLKLRRRGVDINRPRVPSVMRTVAVGTAMTAPPESMRANGDAQDMGETAPLRADDTLERAVRALAITDVSGMPVHDADLAVVGWITHRDVCGAYHVERERMRASDDPA